MTGLEKLRTAVDKDLEQGGLHDYESKYQWVIDRAKHYEEKTGIPYEKIIDSWEEDRSYWYMNYYQDANQPELTGKKVFVFDSYADYREAVGDKGFLCPKCDHASKNPYECDSESCDWKSYGFLGTMGKGAFVFVKDKMKGSSIFMPVAFDM